MHTSNGERDSGAGFAQELKQFFTRANDLNEMLWVRIKSKSIEKRKEKKRRKRKK